MSIESQTLGDFCVRVWTGGAAATPPLLYLHGHEQHPGDAAFLHRLAEGRRVFAPEHPGYGASTGFETVEGVLDVVLFYRELVGSWGIAAIDVVGHSLGGMFAAELAAIAPQVVRRLVLVDAYGLWLDDPPVPDVFGLTDAELRAAKWHDPEAAPDPEPTIFEPDPSDPLAAVMFRAGNLAVAGKFLWPIPDRGLRRRLGLVKARTLVVHGESDGLVPMVYAEEFTRLIPGARLARVGGAGHLPMFEREDEFCTMVDSFLSEEG